MNTVIFVGSKQKYFCSDCQFHVNLIVNKTNGHFQALFLKIVTV